MAVMVESNVAIAASVIMPAAAVVRGHGRAIAPHGAIHDDLRRGYGGMDGCHGKGRQRGNGIDRARAAIPVSFTMVRMTFMRMYHEFNPPGLRVPMFMPGRLAGLIDR